MHSTLSLQSELLGKITTQVPRADISMITSLQEGEMMHLGVLPDTSWQIVGKRHTLHTVQLVDAQLSRAVRRAVPGSEACPQPWHSAADSKAQLD